MIIKISSNHSSSLELHLPFSFKKTCLFLLIFIFLIIFFSGLLVLLVIFILKPQMPEFSLQTVNVESYKLDLSSQNLVVSSVSSLKLLAENPNKVGLSYDPSRFHVLSEGLVVGLIRIPQFHQPPMSKNVTIQTRVLFHCMNISEIMYRNSLKDNSSKGLFQIRILGDIKGQVRIFHITLPKIKVGLDCDISVKQSHFSLSHEVYNMRIIQNMISLPLNSQSVSKKCSLAILM